jgi:conjugal transfer pilus assembly protein TraK
MAFLLLAPVWSHADGEDAPLTALPEVSLAANAETQHPPAASPPSAPQAEKGNRRRQILPFEDKAENTAKLEPGVMMAAPVTVLPEIATTVKLSSSDLNRIVCPTEIKETLTSDEKGVMIKITGKDAFVKFKVGKRQDGKMSYSTTPTEIYIVCGNDTYSMIALPARVPSQTIKLSSGRDNRIKDNASVYSGLPFEKKLLRAIRDVFTDNIADSYVVTQMDQANNTYQGLSIVLRRVVDIEGEGIKIKEFNVSLKRGQEAFRLNEKLFVHKEFTLNPVAVSIDRHTLRPGEVSRVFIVEQRPEKPLGGMGLQIPSFEGDAAVPVSGEIPGQRKPPIPQLPKSQGASRQGKTVGATE